jgi:uncharacterized protein (TIGR02145 family)
MKTKFVFTVLALGLMLHSFGQKYSLSLTFTALDGDKYCQLDSIAIKNITRNVDTILYFPDTVLLLNYPSGISPYGDKDEGFIIMENYPNPVIDESRITLFIPTSDLVKIAVTDYMGRSFFISDYQLSKGYHSFRFIPSKEKIFFFVAQWKGISRAIKILHDGSSNHALGLEYIQQQGSAMKVKSQKEALGFTFDAGDSLLYIGYADKTAGIRGSGIAADKPQVNNIYTFQIAEGIPCYSIPLLLYDYKLYKTLQIGSQCWMRENLSSTHYKNGDPIPNVTADADWYALQSGAYCNYDNDENNGIIYGLLYNGYAMIDSRCLCPAGWHVPSNSEDWQVLIDYYGGVEGLVGGYLKATGDSWASPNTGADNRSGFTGLPGGARFDWNGSYHYIYYDGYWWTSTQQPGMPVAYVNRALYYDHNWFPTEVRPVMNGCSIRCIKDQ